MLFMCKLSNIQISTPGHRSKFHVSILSVGLTVTVTSTKISPISSTLICNCSDHPNRERERERENCRGKYLLNLMTDRNSNNHLIHSVVVQLLRKHKALLVQSLHSPSHNDLEPMEKNQKKKVYTLPCQN